MIFRVPSYYEKFRCTAAACKDNCCIGWEIDIDAQTQAYYDSVGGAFGARLRENIIDGAFRLGEQERCPFLNQNNLCDIYTELGEAHLCQICTDHPRYFAWFDGVKEGGVGLCCEAAAQLILNQTAPFSVIETEIPRESCEEYSDLLFDCLIGAREQMFAYLQNDQLPLGQQLCDVLAFARTLQKQADHQVYSVPSICAAPRSEPAAFSALLSFFTTLEPLDPAWQMQLREQITQRERVSKNMEDFLRENPDVPRYLRNIALYFLWRHFLGGVFEEEFYSRVFLACACVSVIGYQLICHWLETGALTCEDCAEIAKNLSKEVEYSEENVNALADFAYEFFGA